MFCQIMAVGLSALVLLSPAPASAIELFGKKFFETETEDTTVVDPVRYEVTFTQTGLASDAAGDVEAASELIAGKDTPVSGSLGLLVKAKSDRDLLIAALYEQAHYSGVVKIYIEGRELGRIDPTMVFDTSVPVPVEIRIDAGQQFNFGRVAITGDRQGMTPQEFGLVEGEPARSVLVLQAQDEIVTRLMETGHPYAEVAGADIEADHNRGVLDVTLHVRPGPVASIGSVTVVGNETVDMEFIREHAEVAAGSLYSPEHLSAIRRKLLELGVFNSVTVSPGRSLDANGDVPLTIEVTERKHRYFGVGATYSNADGVGIEGYWGHRNLGGRAESFRIEGGISRFSETSELSELNYNAAILFEKPAFYDPSSTFSAKLSAVSETYDAFERRSVRGGVKVSKVIDTKQSFSVGLDVDVSQIEEGAEETGHLIVSTPLVYTYDGSDDPFNPTTGSKVLIELEPSHDLDSTSTFLKSKATVIGYQAVADNVVLAARATVGSIVGANVDDIPADRRFYAGGGGSVRGFEFQTLGPRAADGRPSGGRSLFEASLEARIQVTETLGIVPFFDLGSVSESETPDFYDVRTGAGVGIRYQTPFGPLRVDVGVPLDRRANEDRWGVYAGIGQAF